MKFQGTVAKIHFRNDENGYTVLLLSTEDGDIICVGSILSIHEGENLLIEGELIMHPKYGEQVEIRQVIKQKPNTNQQLIRYLSSDFIPYVGEKTAKKLVETFGDQVIEIIMKDEKSLLSIPGIGQKKAKAIRQAIMDQEGERALILFLQKLHLGPRTSMEIVRIYGAKAQEIIEKNPYQLVEDIPGIGFRTADLLARKQGIEENSLFRSKAALMYIFQEEARRGHCYLELRQVEKKLEGLLGRKDTFFQDAHFELALEGRLVQDQKTFRCYLSSIYYKERDVAHKLVLMQTTRKKLKFDVDQLEKLMGIDLSEEQEEAIQASLKSSILLITGGPGTGKTTIIKAILHVFDQNGLNSMLAAPTGRAAKRMEEATGRQSQTIHRMLGYKGEDLELEFHEDNPLPCDALIVDEASMIDIFLMASLMKAMPMDGRLVFVGDVDQLPSVGPGKVLKDMISSQCLKVVSLKRIYRQGDQSLIPSNARRIQEGLLPICNEKDKDFFFLATKNEFESLDLIEDLVARRLPSYYGFDPKKDLQVLSLMKKGPCGVENLNKLLQRTLNPKASQKEDLEYRDKLFRVGDKLMQVKNNYQLAWREGTEEGEGVFNGDFGEIVAIDGAFLTVDYDGRKVEYGMKDLDEIDHAYCITVHKSQGSQFPVVLLPLFSAPPMLLSKNILYTGISRAEKLVILIGDQRILERMIANDWIQNRNSSLDQRIQAYMDYYQKLGDENDPKGADSIF